MRRTYTRSRTLTGPVTPAFGIALAIVAFGTASCADGDVSTIQRRPAVETVDDASSEDQSQQSEQEPSVVLIISNQSFDDPAVDITVHAGGEAVVQGSFDVGGQHEYVSYDLALPVGPHDLRIESDSGAEYTESIDVESDGTTYVTASYWGGGDPGPSHFSDSAGTEPPGFA